MILFCTCSGGSASTLELSRTRVAVASCKICGGKPLVDERGSLTGSMLSTVGLELTSVINPDLTWKTVSKGNRSATRRARKPISRNSKGTEKPTARSLEVSDKNSKSVEDMPVSESEKLGVSVLGRRFSDKVEHVPIKKRRFLFRSPSPPPRIPSPRAEESGWSINSRPILCQMESSPDSIVKGGVNAISNAVENELGQVVNADIIDRKSSKEIKAKLDRHEDFSGISILAAAACDNSIDGGNVEEGSVDEGSSIPERPFEFLVKCESGFNAKGSLKGGNSLSGSAMAMEVTGVSLETTKASTNNPDTTSSIVLGEKHRGSSQDNSLSISQSLPSNKDDGKLKTLESASRDDRLHWDLNVVMDAWENPCDEPNVDSQTSSVYGISDDSMQPEKVFSETGDSKYAVERTEQSLVGSGVSVGVRDGIDRLDDSKSSFTGIQDSCRELCSLDPCTSSDQTSSYQGKVQLVNNASDNVTDPVEEIKLVYNEQRITSDNEAVTSSPDKHAQEPSTFVDTSAALVEKATAQCTKENDKILSPDQVNAVDTSTDHLSVDMASRPASEKTSEQASPIDACEQAEQFHVSEADTPRNLPASNCDFALSTAKISKRASLDGGVTDRRHDILGDGYVPKMTISVDTTNDEASQPRSLDDTKIISEIKGDAQVSVNHEELSTSGASIEKGEHMVAVDTKVRDVIVSVMDGADLTTADVATKHIDPKEANKDSGQLSGGVEMPIGSHEACKSYDAVNSSGKVAIEDPFDDSDFESDVSHSDPRHVPDTAKTIELQDGDDSQYEDGEVREPIGHIWEEEAGYDGEPEHVDYGSDNRDTYGPEDYMVSLSGQVEEMHGRKERSAEVARGQERFRERNFQGETMKSVRIDGKVVGDLSSHVDKVVGVDNFCSNGDVAELNQLASSQMKLSGWEKLPAGCQISPDMVVDDKEGSGKKNNASAEMLLDSKSFDSQRELPSCMEGTTSSQLFRKDMSIHANRSSTFDDSNPRGEMNPSTAKSMGRGGSCMTMHGRGRGGESWADSPRGNWGQGRHHSPSYYGPANFAQPGSQNAAAAAAAKLQSNGFIVAPDGTIIKAGGNGPCPSGRVQRQPASSPVGQRPITKRGSPTERGDEGFGMPIGLGPVGEVSPDRSTSVGRSRPGRYGPRLVRTGPRERYNGPVPEDGIDSSVRSQHPFARREHSFSPVHRRGAPHPSQPFTRSRSRSRTRSPHVWPSPRGRNVGPGFRQCSRSPPNFRFHVRMERARSPPHHRSGFGADHIDGFGSTPRSRASPPHSSRWVDNRKDGPNHFREHGYKHRFSERGSPGRPMRRGHRDMTDSSIRLRPDEFYSRSMHPGRFQEMGEAGRGPGPRYDGSDEDRRKHGERFSMVHPVRRYDTEEPVKRFRHDIEDGFAFHNSRNKDLLGFHGRGNPKEDYVRGIDSRLGDAPRRAREDKGHFRYGRDGKYNTNSKSFGRDCEDEIAPRRRRPS